MKKIISIALCVFMLITSFAIVQPSVADISPPASTKVIVTNIFDLQNMSDNLNGNYVLQGNIDGEPTANWTDIDGDGFMPIGNSTDPFKGTFNGNGFVITRLFINRSIVGNSTSENVGLFGFIGNTGSVGNITLHDLNVSGLSNVGGIAGFSRGFIYNCTVYGRTKGLNDVAGIVGRNAGGLVQECKANGNVTSTDIRAGGVAGTNKNGFISRCNSSAEVRGFAQIGGLVGRNNGGTIQNSYSKGNAFAINKTVGGLVANNSGDILNCYSIGHVNGTVEIGGLVGYNEGTVNHSYWDNVTSGLNTSDGGDGRHTGDMMLKSTFVNWNFQYIWSIDENVTYPFLNYRGSDLSTNMSLTVILGSPTNDSIVASVLAMENLEVYLEWGHSHNSYTDQTPVYFIKKGIAKEINITGLSPNTEYKYQLRYRLNGTLGPFSEWNKRFFRTQKSPGSKFTFTITSDSHFEEQFRYNENVYRRALRSIKNDTPDFHLDLGDTFITQRSVTDDYDAIVGRYIEHRDLFDIIAESSPLYHASGNWDAEDGWNVNGSANSMTVNATLARTRNYPFPDPVVEDFYSGNTSSGIFAGDREDYYGWEWGDALFLVLHPYWYTNIEPTSVDDKWEWSLGWEQYSWMRSTLENSTAKFKFVFSHHVHGLTRGGVEQARLFEWGGYDKDGVTYSFDTHRPGWGKPIHQVFVDTNVTIYFQGHDHVYVRDTLDGVIYQTVPQPSNLTYSSGFGEYYATGIKLNNSGYLRVTVNGSHDVDVEYVRTVLAADETANFYDGMVSYEYSYPDDLPPTIQHHPIDSAQYNETINVTARILDNFEVVAAGLNYTNATGVNFNVSMNNWQGNWSYDIPAQNEFGYINYFIWAVDSSSFTNNTPLFNISLVNSTGGTQPTIIADNIPPEINHTPIISANVQEPITIMAEITDQYDINEAFLGFHDTTLTDNYVQMARSGFNFSFDIPAQLQTGIVSYFIWASDVNGNINQTQNFTFNVIDNILPEIVHENSSFVNTSIPLTIIADISDNLGISQVKLNYTGTDMVNYNISMTAAGSGQWTADIPGQANPGDITYFIWAMDINNNQNASRLYTVYVEVPILPRVLVAYPEGIDVQVNTTIIITFSRPMDTDSVELAIQISPPIAISDYDWKVSDTTLEITPAGNLSHGTEYNITVLASAEDTYGNNIGDDYTWSFTTVEEIVQEVENSQWIWLILIIIVTVAAIAVIYFITRTGGNKPEDEGPPEEETPNPNQAQIDRIQKAYDDGKISEEMFLKNMEKFGGNIE